MATGRSRPSAVGRVARAVLVLWAIHALAVGLLLAGIDVVAWCGLWPRELRGLPGILTAHLLHADLGHLASNSAALLIIGTVACWCGARLAALAAAISALAAGAFTWVAAPPGVPHVGASGIVFGLVAFVAANGLLRRGCLPLLLAIPAALLLSGLVPAMLPSDANRVQMVSWQMHLGGCLGGLLASWLLRRVAR